MLYKAMIKLLAITNASLRTPKPKPGRDHQQPENHKSISPLPTFSKIPKKFMLTKFWKEIDLLRLLPPKQFGFHKNHSTTLQALRLTETIHDEGFSNTDVTAIPGHSNSIWQSMAWWPSPKLVEAGLHIYITKIISSFLQEQTFRVKVKDCKSTIRPIRAGVLQGSDIHPLPSKRRIQNESFVCGWHWCDRAVQRSRDGCQKTAK